MRTALQDLALEQLYVVHPGEHEFPLADAITAIPLSHLMERLKASSVAAAPVAESGRRETEPL
jgi:hypothetical protein